MLQRVLIIDDSRMARIQIRGLLELQGAEVFELGSADEFFSQSWRFQGIDLIILDINLPGMDGLQALEQIRRDQHFSRTKVIMLTARAEQLAVLRAHQLGAVDYVTKPIDSEDFVRRVRRTARDGRTPQRTSLAHHLKMLTDVVRLELKRARRGKNEFCVGLVRMAWLESADQPRRDRLVAELTANLRETDMVFPLDQSRVAMVLPFTGKANLGVVEAKLKSPADGPGGTPALFAWSAYPEDGDREEILVQMLLGCDADAPREY